MSLLVHVVSGKLVDIENLRIEDINTYDILQALHLSNRYNGQTPIPWSVLSHSYRVYQLYLQNEDEPINKHETFAALFHDSAESYVGDIISPLKKRPEFAYFRELEDKIRNTILESFNVDLTKIDWDKVDFYDKLMTCIEVEQFFLGNNLFLMPKHIMEASKNWKYPKNELTPIQPAEFYNLVKSFYTEFECKNSHILKFAYGVWKPKE